MGNIFERLMKNKGFVSAISFALLVSILLNGFLVIQTVQLDNQLNEQNKNVKTDEGNSNYEAIISSLERENSSLEKQLQQLAEGDIDVDEIEVSETGDTDSEQPEVIIDERVSDREELIKFTSEFIHNFLTRSKDLDQDRRENLKPYLSDDLLDTFVPEDQEAVLDFEVEHGDVEDTVEGGTEYSVELIDQTIYIDEDSLGKDLQNVLIYVTTKTVVNDSSPTNERSIIDIRVNNGDGGLEVNNIYVRYLND